MDLIQYDSIQRIEAAPYSPGAVNEVTISPLCNFQIQDECILTKVVASAKCKTAVGLNVPVPSMYFWLVAGGAFAALQQNANGINSMMNLKVDTYHGQISNQQFVEINYPLGLQLNPALQITASMVLNFGSTLGATDVLFWSVDFYTKQKQPITILFEDITK